MRLSDLNSKMELLSNTNLDSLNECLYTHFVDLFTQPRQPERKSFIQSPSGQIFKDVVPSYGVARALETSLSEAINTKCLLLPTGSSAGGVVVPAYEYTEEGCTCRYDSDVDYMFCMDFSDLFRWCQEYSGHASEIGHTEKVVPTVENSKEHPGFCLVKLPPELVKILPSDTFKNGFSLLSDKEGEMLPLLCLCILLFIMIPICYVQSWHCSVFVLIVVLTILLHWERNESNEYEVLWGPMANLFRLRPMKNDTGTDEEDVVMAPRDFIALVYFLLVWVSKSGLYILRPYNDSRFQELRLDHFISFSITGPSIQTIIDLTKFKESYLLDIVYSSFKKDGPEICDIEVEGFDDNSESQESGEACLSVDDSTLKTEDMDVVPALSFPGWPVGALAWLTRKRQWPEEDLVREIGEAGFHLVTVQPKSEIKPTDLWRISFSRAELKLLCALPDKSWCKQTYRIFKWLIKGGLRTPKGILPSYFLLTIFFWCLESHHPDQWNNKTLARYTLLLLDKLIFSLTCQQLPNYFIPESNLMGHMDPHNMQTVLQLVSKLRRNPMQFCLRPNIIPWDAKMTGITIEDMLAWPDENDPC